MMPRHEAYLASAVDLRDRFKPMGMTIAIGFEGEWLGPRERLLINELIMDPRADYWIGSVHHILDVPIDYNKKMWDYAMKKSVELADFQGLYYMPEGEEEYKSRYHQCLLYEEY